MKHLMRGVIGGLVVALVGVLKVDGFTCYESPEVHRVYSERMVPENQPHLASYFRALRNLTAPTTTRNYFSSNAEWGYFTQSVADRMALARDRPWIVGEGWYRNALIELNHLVRILGSTAAVPVWDAARLTNDLSRDPALSPQFFGGRPGPDGCLVLSQAPHLLEKFPTRRVTPNPLTPCVTRDLKRLQATLPNLNQVNKMMRSDRATAALLLREWSPHFITVDGSQVLWPLNPADPLLYSYLAYLESLADRWCLHNTPSVLAPPIYFRGEEVRLRSPKTPNPITTDT